MNYQSILRKNNSKMLSFEVNEELAAFAFDRSLQLLHTWGICQRNRLVCYYFF